MNFINIILVIILISLNFQYYNLNEESKILKETIMELKDQNQSLSQEINKMSIINSNSSYTTNSTLNSILYFGGIVLIAGIAFYFLNGYLFDTSTQSLEASKIINQTTSDYTNNLMNQIHSQNLSQITWLDKKFDSLITMIHKANIFNNQWFLENVMPNLQNQTSISKFELNVSPLVDKNNFDTFQPDKYIELAAEKGCLTNLNLDKNIDNNKIINFMSSFKNIAEKEGSITQALQVESEILKVMEKTLETAEWI